MPPLEAIKKWSSEERRREIEAAAGLLSELKKLFPNEKIWFTVDGAAGFYFHAGRNMSVFASNIHDLASTVSGFTMGFLFGHANHFPERWRDHVTATMEPRFLLFLDSINTIRKAGGTNAAGSHGIRKGKHEG